MFNTIENVLNAAELAELRAIAARASFIDGRISAPGASVKNNLVMADRAYFDRSAQLVADALYRSEDFRVFAFPKAMMPPVLTRYGTGMYYGTHTDAAFMLQPSRLLRSDLSCTVFVSEPDSYEGGELVTMLGNAEMRLRAPAGAAILYPSTTLHRVEQVTKGERLVALTFIQSQIADSEQRELLYELNEIAAGAADKMDIADLHPTPARPAEFAPAVGRSRLNARPALPRGSAGPTSPRRAGLCSLLAAVAAVDRVAGEGAGAGAEDRAERTVMTVRDAAADQAAGDRADDRAGGAAAAPVIVAIVAIAVGRS